MTGVVCERRACRWSPGIEMPTDGMSTPGAEPAPGSARVVDDGAGTGVAPTIASARARKVATGWSTIRQNATSVAARLSRYVERQLLQRVAARARRIAAREPADAPSIARPRSARPAMMPAWGPPEQLVAAERDDVGAVGERLQRPPALRPARPVAHRSATARSRRADRYRCRRRRARRASPDRATDVSSTKPSTR